MTEELSLIGKKVGNFEVVEQLGEGGMGVVYLACHNLMPDKKAAIKVLHWERSTDRQTVNRFFNEAKSASVINDPGIVDIYDFGYLDEGLAYIVMEFLEGRPLSSVIQSEGPLPEPRAIEIGWHIAKALESAHRKGIIHRDLKPDNILVVQDPASTSGERTKVVDFGIAKLTGKHKPNESVQTLTGAIFGTPRYMSPEQCRGSGGVDHRSDIYALGCILYEMVTGVAPFVHEGAGEVLKMHLVDPPVSPRENGASVSKRLEKLILQMLEKPADDRPQSMDEVAQALGRLRVAAGDPEVTYVPKPRERPTKRTGLIALGLAIAFGVPLLLKSTGKPPAEEKSVALPQNAVPTAPTVQNTKIDLSLSSEPSGASIYRFDGVKIGTTPWSKSFEKTDGTLELTLRQPGFEAKVVELSLKNSDSQHVTLKASRVKATTRRVQKRSRTNTRSPKPPARPAQPANEKKKTRRWGELIVE